MSLNGQDLTPTAGKLRTVLALFALRNDHTVSTDEFIYELWPESPPKTAQATVQTYVYKLRKALGGACGTTELLRTEAHGYRLTIPDESLDFRVFEQLAQHARVSLDHGDCEGAVHSCRQALALWQGPALAGVPQGSLLSGLAMRLEETRIRTLETRIEADLRLGRHREVISKLREAIHVHPLHEEFHRQLMLALYRSGRCSEALAVYRRLWQTLMDEVGTEPSAPLRQLHGQMLTAEAVDVAEPPVRERSGRAATGGRPAPVLLPPDLPDFVGRVQQLERCENWLCSDRTTGAGARLLSVTGMPGVGKNAFALRLAHQLVGAFEDGRLYADLSEGTSTHEVLGRFLHALGVAERDLPEHLDDRATLFWERTRGGRFLVVLRAPTSAAQIARLTPNSPVSAVVMTRGPRYPGPAGSWVLDIRPLRPHEGVALLAGLVGEDQVERERDEAEGIVGLCGHLPLAIRCVGLRVRDALQRGEHRTLADVRDELINQARLGTMLDVFSHGGLDLRGRIAEYHAHLTPRECKAFRVLGSLGMSTVFVKRIAPLMGCDESTANAVMCRLLERNLIGVASAPTADPSFSCHPLIRRYAVEMIQGVRVSEQAANGAESGAPG
ncbi:AfsR/SARP family transcriptional regulator [Streptomyces acidicola]|uniref:AfsR/SARP family transcriptional regulator n=1 Tax=Streptomyces acidicola TaxID=2596892 RepID=UPI0038301236